jgi:hypothetical protein
VQASRGFKSLPLRCAASTLFHLGEVSERSKERDWKSRTG